MSFILEALRKSEAERRRGQAPQLFDAPPPRPVPPPAAARAHWRWAAPAVVLLSLAFVWWKGDRNDAAPDAAAPAAAAPVSVPVPDDARIAGGAPSTAEGTGVSATGLMQPSNSTVEARAVPADSTTPQTAGVAPVGAGASAPPRPTTAPPTAPVSGSPAPVLTDAGPATTRVAAVPAQPPTEATPAAPSVQPLPTATPDAPLRLADLSSNERSALPPLRMSMHLWAPVPADRFVILDGNRVGEGDRVGNTVVEQIAPDGVVLAWQGRRLKLPVR